MIAAALVLMLLAPEGTRVPIPIDPIPPAPARIDILDRCAGPDASEIVVCAGRGERGANRVPDTGFDPAGDVQSVSRERNALLEPGVSGTGSCSPVGGGGATGCLVQSWRRQQQQKAGR